jgi:thioredoxin-like negative regulator of GroEL
MRQAIVCALLVIGCAKDKGESTASGAAAPASATVAAPKAAAAARVVEIPNSGDFDALVAGEAAKARADGLVPFLEFEASWCPPCKAIAKTLADRDAQMVDAFAGTAIIQVDLDAWPKPAEALHVDAIPVFLALDNGGKPTARKIDGGAWADNVPENMAPPLKKFFHSGTN